MKLLSSIFLFILCAFIPSAQAQDYTDLQPKDYPVGDELPVYSTQIRFAKGNTQDNTEIILEYPECTKLNNKEINILKNRGFDIPEKPILNVTYGIERKICVADVSFIPLIKKGEDYYRLTSFRLVTTQKKYARSNNYTNSTNTSTSRYASNSVLASGKWVKIAVSKEGIYQITPALAQQWGFSNFNNIKVYGYGGLPQSKKLYSTTSIIDDLNEVATYRTNDKILFFAEGLVRRTWNNSAKRWKHENNTFAKQSYYFITEGETPQQLEQESQNTPETIVTEVPHLALYDEDSYAWYEGGRQFYDAYNFATGNTKTYTLNTPEATSNSASLEISFSASNALSNTNVKVMIGEQSLGSFNIRYCRSHESAIDKRQTYSLSNLTDVTPIKFTTTEGRDARLNYLSLTYSRRLTAKSSPYSFVPTPTSSTPVNLLIAQASPSTQVWRISETTGEISCCSALLSGENLTAVAQNGKDRYIIVNTDHSYESPTYVSDVNNQNLHADYGVHMVIIVPESGKFDEEATRLAEAHRLYNNLNVKIVHQHLIFNEFSSGTPDATAIRRYLKMLYDKAESESDMPRYLLMFGDGAYDNRMITSDWKSFSPKDYLLTYQENDNYDNSSESVMGDIVSYPTDDYFCLLDDGEGGNVKTEKIDLGVGRFVCSTVEDAKVLVDKSINYMRNQRTGSWKNRIVMIGDAPRSTDVGDKNAHMEDAERTAATILKESNNKFNIRRVYPDYYERQMTATGYRFPKATEVLTEEIKRGALIFNYSGHGSPAQISHSFIFEATDWDKVKSDALPLWVLASCEILPYDRSIKDFGRMALFAPNGGAVAVMCASRAVYATENNVLNIAFCEALVKRNDDGSYNTLGDAMRIAKNKLITTAQDRSINKLKYIIAGDPALRIMQPTLNVTIDKINNISVEDSKNIQLKAGSVATIEGYIDNEPNFSGVLTATLYDKIETLTCRNSGNVAESAFTYSERTKVVFSGSDSIRNGRFKIFIPIPLDISYSTESARLSLYAVNQDGGKEANGIFENFHLNGTEPGLSEDKMGPKIFLYLNDAEFPNGGITNQSPLLVAKLSDDSGINATGTSLGHDLELILDGETNHLIVLNNYFSYDFGTYKEGTVSYQLSNLSPGRHTLSLRAWDHNNNSTTSTLNFVVGASSITSKALYASINPARTFTQFVANIPEAHIGGTITLEVYTTTGQKVWTNTSTIDATYSTQRWNLTSSSGLPLPKGIYIFRSIISSPQGEEEIDGERLIII